MYIKENDYITIFKSIIIIIHHKIIILIRSTLDNLYIREFVNAVVFSNFPSYPTNKLQFAYRFEHSILQIALPELNCIQLNDLWVLSSLF